MQSRRAGAKILYKGQDISNGISLTIGSRDERWLNDMFPHTGNIITAEIEVLNWNGLHDNRSLPLGDFEIDCPTFEETLTINAVTIPITSNVRSEKKNRAWVDIALSGIAGDIAGTANLNLIYDRTSTPFTTMQTKTISRI